MVLKIFRVIWFVSVLALFLTLLFNYAGWAEELIIQQDGNKNVTINKEIFFYLLVTIFAFINVLVYVIAKIFQRNIAFRTWFHGLITTINIFFVIALSLIGLYNSFEAFDYERIGFIIYGSVTLVLLWALTWPVYLMIQKLSLKEPVG
jgi:hypothetical protein